MVSPCLAAAGPSGRRAAAAALILLAACGRAKPAGQDAAGSDPASRDAARVRDHYDRGDALAAGAWTWAAPDGTRFVLVDVQSAVPGMVQGRLDLWHTSDSGDAIVGRSDAMPSAAGIGAYAVGDLTGDGLPDLFGYVADSADVRYPVFLPGARGGLVDGIAAVSAGWRFDVLEPNEPTVAGGPGGPCALQLWAEDPAPDGRPAGWRWLPFLRGGRLGPPGAVQPACR